MSHTPGPWTVSELMFGGEVSEHHIFIEPDVAVIERKVAGHDQHDMANAHLIAAAPQLLEALERLIEAGGNLRTDLSTVQGMRDMSNLLEATDAARAAIRAAKGEA